MQTKASPETKLLLSSELADGIPVSSDTYFQAYPQLVSDGAGGAILTWEEFRDVDKDIYAQRINSDGTLQWTAEGVVICTAAEYQYDPEIVNDGSGGAIITWEDYRSGGGGSSTDIYVQKINSTGDIQWTANGVAICTVAEVQNDPEIVSDGSGGAIITWEDYRNGSNYDVYAQRINSAGVVQWTTNGVAICTITTNELNIRIATDSSGGAIIAWQDNRIGGGSDIYAQRINSAGVVQWTINGVAICTLPLIQMYLQLISDGSGGVIITWQSNFNSNYDIYAQRVNSTGNVNWTVNGVVICNEGSEQKIPKLASDGSGGAIITWQDYRSGNSYDIYAQRITNKGSVNWTANGITISNTAGIQQDLQILSDGAEGAIITWEMGLDIYAQRINSTGTFHWFNPPEDPPVEPSGAISMGSFYVLFGILGIFYIIWNFNNNRLSIKS